MMQDRRERNYAYNINNSPNGYNSKKISFNSLSKNFYEELINTDYNLKNKRQILNEIKNKSIKESIYSNKNIPNTWKTMLDYQNQVYHAIDQDHDFAHYIGRSQKEAKSNEFFETPNLKTSSSLLKKEKNSDTASLKDLPKFIKDFIEGDQDEKNQKSKTINTNESNIINNISTIPSTVHKNNISPEKEQKDFGKSIRKQPTAAWNDKNDLLNNDKLISSKLDEYRTKYDLNKFMYEIKNKRLKEKKDLFNNSYNPNLKETNYREFLKSRTQNEKGHVLKSSIYYNLLGNKTVSENDKNLFKSSSNFKNTKKEDVKPSSLYLNYNAEFDKNIEITNPKIKRDLELINYYGPRYTHCNICNHRNLEFYQTSEPNQTLKLLHYLKRVRLGEEKEDNKS